MKMKKQITIAIDEECSGEIWWNWAKKRTDCPDEIKHLEPGKWVNSSEETLKWCEQDPGWNDGPEYAPCPLMVSCVFTKPMIKDDEKKV